MKRTLLIGLLLTSVSAFAFMGHPGDNRMMFDELNLTEKQEQQLTTIRKASRDEQIKLMDKMDELRQKTDREMMGVLTQEQQAKFKEIRKEMRRAIKQPRNSDCPDRDTMVQMKPRCDR